MHSEFKQSWIQILVYQYLCNLNQGNYLLWISVPLSLKWVPSTYSIGLLWWLNEIKFIKYLTYYWPQFNDSYSDCDHFLHGFYVFWSILPALILVPPHLPSTQLSDLNYIYGHASFIVQVLQWHPKSFFCDKVLTPWLAHKFLCCLDALCPSDLISDTLNICNFFCQETKLLWIPPMSHADQASIHSIWKSNAWSLVPTYQVNAYSDLRETSLKI